MDLTAQLSEVMRPFMDSAHQEEVQLQVDAVRREAEDHYAQVLAQTEQHLQSQ